MIFSDPIAKLSFAIIENYYMLIRLRIQDTLADNIYSISRLQAKYMYVIGLWKCSYHLYYTGSGNDKVSGTSNYQASLP
jgi:hypothetical protein